MNKSSDLVAAVNRLAYESRKKVQQTVETTDGVIGYSVVGLILKMTPLIKADQTIYEKAREKNQAKGKVWAKYKKAHPPVKK